MDDSPTPESPFPPRTDSLHPPPNTPSHIKFTSEAEKPETMDSDSNEIGSPVPSTAKSSRWTPKVFRKDKDNDKDSAKSILGTPSKQQAPSRRKGSLGSILTLPLFGARSKQKEDNDTDAPDAPSPAPSKPPKRTSELVDSTAFRCDIFPQNSEDYRAAEAECKQIVREAGGELLDDTLYPGGFLYDMANAPNPKANPLEDGDETEGGGYVTITPFMRFKAPQWNPLRMHPPYRLFIRAQATPPRTPIPSTPTRASDPVERASVQERRRGRFFPGVVAPAGSNETATTTSNEEPPPLYSLRPRSRTLPESGSWTTTNSSSLSQSSEGS